MADDWTDSEDPPFEFVDMKDHSFICRFRSATRADEELEISASMFRPSLNIDRAKGQKKWKKVVYAEPYGRFLTIQALKERLERPSVREEDYNALQNNPLAKPIELWNRNGTVSSTPTQMFLTSSAPYNDTTDERQLERWKRVATTLGKPPQRVDLARLRFRLRPSEALKKKKNLLYCTPANPPVFNVTKEKLEGVIKSNKGDFDGWPDPVVVSYADAKKSKLKLVGWNFLQLYFMWMRVEDYEELWDGLKVSELLHPLPTTKNAEKKYREIDQMLKKNRSGRPIDGVPTEISSKTIGSRDRSAHGKTTFSVMGASATKLANELWGAKCMTSGMGTKSKVEWLHRVAYGLGGQDVFKNLVFGTWECNTDMIRVESMVKALTKKNDNGTHRKGRLTTMNKTTEDIARSGKGKLTVDATNQTISRFTLGKVNKTETVPKWTAKYSWLSFSLKYRYEMDKTNSPLGASFAAEIDLDPWSLYMPLSIEPRLDTKILDALKPTGRKIVTVKGRNMQMLYLASNEGHPDSLPDRPLLEYSSDEYATLALIAATNRLPCLELPDIVIKHPTIAQGPLPDNIPVHESAAYTSFLLANAAGSPVSEWPVPGFVLQGDVDLFGTTVVGKLEKWVGPPPEDVIVGDEPPSIERVVIPGDFHMSMFIPLLQDTPFDDMIFRNVAVYHQNYAFDKTKSVGWHFNADWVIDDSCGPLHDILTKALQVDKPILSIHAALGEDLQWGAPLELHSFILEGVFSDLTLSPVSGLTLTSIGVRLLGIRGLSFAPEPHSTLSFGFGIFGTMKLNVPGSVVPLNLEYEMGLMESTVNLRAEISGSIWQDALGVKGLLLEDVTFGTSFSTTALWDSFAFEVSATFSYMNSQAFLEGTYAAGGHFSLTAELDNFEMEDINDLFSATFSDSLTMPHYDIHVGSAILSIVSGQGLSLSLLDVNIEGHTAASLEVALSSSGASLSGKLSSSAVKFGDVELRDALIKLSFWTTGQKKNVDLTLGGTLSVDFLDVTVGAVVHLYPGEDGVEWTVVAGLNASNRPFSISDVVPAVKDSFVDFSLKDVVFIAASDDDPSVSQLFPGYQVKKGVHVFAVIDRIPALDDLLHENVKGLVLDAGWSKDSGFNLSVSLPAESSISLGNGIRTTPIQLGIRTSPPELAVMAGVTVPMKDSTPLDFSFVLAANTIGASASAQMQGWWVKPFGIENLKIGPEVTLAIEIVYAQFVSTGTPSGFGVSGGLMIGSTEAFIAMNISEDPERQMLFGQLKKLDISDVVTFASTVVTQEIPKIPDGLLKFEELKVYICPFGITLGKTSYPQGFSFKADLLLFGKRAGIECTIDKSQKSIDIIGSVDNFELGPLSVRGSNGPRAMLECHVGTSKQQLVIDGVISLFDIQAQTYINLQFLPEPIFKFHLLLRFAQMFMFKLDAELLGSIHDRISDADFSLHAELQNNILEYIAQQIIEQFEAAKVAATYGLQAAQEKVSDAQKAWEAAIADEEKRVENTRREWESHNHSVRNSSQHIIDQYVSEMSRLRGEVEKTRRDFNNACDDARRAVNQANQDRGAAMAAAHRDVDEAKRDMDNAINEAQRKLNEVEADLSQAFGNAKRDIDNAEREVDSLQNQINDIKWTINEFDNAPWYEFWKKAAIAGLWTAVGTLEASRAVAIAALEVARCTLTGSEFISKDGAVGVAHVALEGARTAGSGALAVAQEALDVADQTSKAAVDVAEGVLEAVQKGAEFIAFQGATEALELFENAGKVGYDVAVATIDALVDSAEFIAFHAAKAGLAIAKGSTKLLDAAREGLQFVEKVTQSTLTILQAVVEFGAKAVNIKTIILSGTLRGILGIGGDNARPLSAVVKGYVLGAPFDIQVEFDLRTPVAFITAIFKALWSQVTDLFRISTTMALINMQPIFLESGSINDMSRQTDPAAVLAAKSRFLQERPDVLKTLTDKSEMILLNKLCGPFSGRPTVSSLVVAERALTLIHEAKGVSVFGDLDVV